MSSLLDSLLDRAGVTNDAFPPEPALPEGAMFDFDGNGPTLHIRLARPSPQEIADIRRGPCEFGLLPLGPILFLLSKFGTQDWMDAPYSIQMLPPRARVLPEEYRPGLHYALAAIILDTNTQSQRGARFVTFSAEFSERLHVEVQGQLKYPLSRGAYDAAIADAYRRFPTAESMVSYAVARTVGGA